MCASSSYDTFLVVQSEVVIHWNFTQPRDARYVFTGFMMSCVAGGFST
jgi:hypothetical protein